MSETPGLLVYAEPTVMWRMRRADGASAHAVISPHPDGAVVVWYFNGRPLGFKTFGDLATALFWTEQMQAQNWAVGWRLSPDYD